MRRTPCLLLLFFSVSCHKQESVTTSPSLVVHDFGVVFGEPSLWIAHEYDIVLPPELAAEPLEARPYKSCCTKIEIVNRVDRRLKVRLGCRLPSTEGVDQWMGEVAAADKGPFITLVARARIVAEAAFIDAPAAAGVRLKGAPATWTTSMEVRHRTPPETIPPAVIHNAENPKISVGEGTLRQEVGLYIVSYPITAIFTPEGKEGLHEQESRMTTGKTELPIRFAWYEMKGK
jgi:hypothetical protein